MGKYSDALRRQFAALAHDKQRAPKSLSNEPYQILKEIHRRVSNLTDKNPFWQVVHHLALVMDLWGPHKQEAGESWEALMETPKGEELYADFMMTLWNETARRLRADAPLIDPVGDLYVETELVHSKQGGLGQFLTPMSLVHTMNTMAIGNDEKDTSEDRLIKGEDGLLMPKIPLIDRDKYLTVMDPACGTGRFGLDAMVFYPRATQWNIDIDLQVYQLAVLNSRLLLPWTTLRTYLGDRPAAILMGRANNLWADSLVIDISHPHNWNLGRNKWDPPDWRTEYLTQAGKTLWELEKDVGENHAYEELRDRNTKNFDLGEGNSQRMRVTKRPPAPPPETEQDSEAAILAAQFHDMPSAPGSRLPGPPEMSLLNPPSITDSLGAMLSSSETTHALTERFLSQEENANRARIEANPEFKKLAAHKE